MAGIGKFNVTLAESELLCALLDFLEFYRKTLLSSVIYIYIYIYILVGQKNY